jgi:hypothetical protein
MHGFVTTSAQDTFTTNGTGQSIAIPPAPNPSYPRRWHVFTKWVCTGTVTGAVLSYDVQFFDGTWVDSGQPNISVAGVALSGVYEGIVSSMLVKGVRCRIAGWTGGTNCVTTTTLVDLA